MTRSLTLASIAPAATWMAALWMAASPADAQFAGRDPADCAAMSSGEVEVIPYEIQRGDSCARVARRMFGDRSRYDLIHAYNPGMGPPPHRLTAGTYLCLPRTAPPRGSGPAARITAIRQRVRARPPEDADWIPARLGQGVDRGSRVNTLTAAFAELTFQDTSVVTLRGDTLVVVYGATEGAVRRGGTEAVLERGALRSRLGELRGANDLEVRTPTSRVALSGGSAVTTVDDEATTRVSNHSGGAARVAGADGAGAVRVAPGMGSKVRRGARPSRPRPLPDAPDWAGGQPARFVGVAQLTTVVGAWQPVEGARVYRVEISRHADGRELVAQVEVPSDVTRFELHRLPPGTYHARLSTIDGDFFESRPSDAWSFEVELGRLLQPGQAPAEEAAFDFGDASEEPQPLVLLPGARLTAPDGVQCGVGEGAPAAELAFVESGEGAVRCVDASGAPIGGFAVSVAEVTLGSAEGDAGALQATRGREVVLPLRVRSAAALPGALAVRGGEGVEVLGTEREGDVLSVRVRVSADAPDEVPLTLAASEDGPPIAETRVVVGDPAPLATPEAPPPPAVAPEAPPRPVWAQTFGTTLLPSVVGLRDAGRGGIGAWIAAGWFAADDALEPDRFRGSAGARAALLGRQLHLEAAAAVDFEGAHERTAQRGSGDVWGAAGYRPDLGDDVDVLFEAGAFFPTQQDASGLGVVRLMPSVHLSLPFEERWLFRTRQGAAVDLDGSGNALWVSAYGVDARLVGPLIAGAELSFSLGQEDADLLVLPLAGASVGVAAGPLVLSLGARFGLTEEAWETMGPYSVFFTVEAGAWDLERIGASR
ncbi:MAG: hypothetical protein VYE22_37790 [Myxococcota bacterium]|nr:hypothetical protein [Myxococcota bacterium]